MKNPLLFKNLSILDLNQDDEKQVLRPLSQFESNLEKLKFRECKANTVESIGFGEIDSEVQKLFVQQGELYLMRLVYEHKKPDSRQVKEMMKELVENDLKRRPEGYKHTKIELSEFKSSVLNKLIPITFPKREQVYFIVDTYNNKVFVDSSSKSMIPLVATMLSKATEGEYQARNYWTQGSLEYLMSSNYTERYDDDNISFGESIEMKGASSQKIIFKNCYLFDEHIHHYSSVASTQKIQLFHEKGYSFVLDSSGALKSFKDEEGSPPDLADLASLESALMELLDYYGGLYNTITQDLSAWLRNAEQS